MNKFLQLSAAALLGTVSPSIAAQDSRAYTISFHTAGGGSYCDGLSFQKTGHRMAAGLHLNEDCVGGVGQMGGWVDKEAYLLSESYESNLLLFEISKPVRDGGKWDLALCYSGATCFVVNSGIYSIGFRADRKRTTATTSKVSDLLATRRALRTQAMPGR